MRMTTQLIHFTQWARETPQPSYTALMGLLCDPEGLRAQALTARREIKPTGIDGVRKADYALDLDARLAALSQQVRQCAYRPVLPGELISPRPMAKCARWVFPALKTALCKTACPASCKRSGNPSSEIIPTAFARDATTIKPLNGWAKSHYAGSNPVAGRGRHQRLLRPCGP